MQKLPSWGLWLTVFVLYVSVWAIKYKSIENISSMSFLTLQNLLVSKPSHLSIPSLEPLIPSYKPKLSLPLPPTLHTPHLSWIFTRNPFTLLATLLIDILALMRVYDPLRRADEIIADFVRSVKWALVQVWIFTTVREEML